MIQISSLENLPVYTRGGTFVGYVKNTILDLDQCRVDALILTRTNTRMVEKGMEVAVPYRWVAAVDDILMLHHFPKKVALPTSSKKKAKKEEAEASAPTPSAPA